MNFDINIHQVIVSKDIPNPLVVGYYSGYITPVIDHKDNYKMMIFYYNGKSFEFINRSQHFDVTDGITISRYIYDEDRYNRPDLERNN